VLSALLGTSFTILLLVGMVAVFPWSRRKKAAENLALEIAAAKAEVGVDEERFRSLFEDSPVSLWEQDYSRVRTTVDEIIRSGVTDLRAHFRAHPGLAKELGAMIRVVDVNQATVDLYGAKTKEDLLGNLGVTIGEASEELLAEQLATLAEGNNRFEFETVMYRLRGETGLCLVLLAIASGSETSWSKVFVAIVDISGSK
jgi:PAS domain-containing protein